MQRLANKPKRYDSGLCDDDGGFCSGENGDMVTGKSRTNLEEEKREGEKSSFIGPSPEAEPHQLQDEDMVDFDENEGDDWADKDDFYTEEMIMNDDLLGEDLLLEEQNQGAEMSSVPMEGVEGDTADAEEEEEADGEEHDRDPWGSLMEKSSTKTKKMVGFSPKLMSLVKGPIPKKMRGKNYGLNFPLDEEYNKKLTIATTFRKPVGSVEPQKPPKRL